MLTPEQRRQKKRYIRYVIILCLCLIPLLGYIQRGLLGGGINLGISSTVLIFALININGLLVLLMLYLVLRNLVELVFERKQKILGSKLRTRMVVSFVSLSLVPTALLFMIALRFVSTSMDYWFNTNVEESLAASLKLAQTIYQETEQRAKNMGLRTVSVLQSTEMSPYQTENIKELFNRILAIAPPGAPDGLALLAPNNSVILSELGTRLDSPVLQDLPSEAIRHAAVTDSSQIISRETASGELIQSITPIKFPETLGEAHFLVTTLLIPIEQLKRMQAVSGGMTDYQQLVMLKAPIKLSLLIMLLIITLLILFGAIWFGFYISRSLTGPINSLADATRRVAEGELDFTIARESEDEMGLLVDSFNKMTSDLRQSNSKLASAHEALEKSRTVAEERRQYLETVLRNVTAGVISIAADDTITTINRFAEDLLEIDASQFLGKDYNDVLIKSHVNMLTSFITELEAQNKPKKSIQRHLRFTVRRGKTYSLLVNVTRLADEEGKLLGHVIVFDNLTKLEKAQRLAAWQEVARRIAHEIKNPLTPIQLSAQRLRKRYMQRLSEDGDVFDQCTNTIVSQVDEIKRLVSEFSDFARMPKIRKQLGDLAAIAEETLVLYREAHKNITFTLDVDEGMPRVSFDPVQLKRVLINLLDNAVTALNDKGEIRISLFLNPVERTAVLEVADTGPGIKGETKLRLFEPYFSTRKSGTGLGLAISHTVIAEHDGTITVRDNRPHGAVFTVELPLDT